MNKESLRPAAPLFLVFVLITLLCLAARNWMTKNGISPELVLWGNFLIAAISGLAWYLNLRSLRSTSPSAPVRGMYAGFMVKFFLLALAAFVYIMTAKGSLNKPGLMICAGLYILYTALETRALMQQARKKKNA